jgi:hypothetical protein
MPRLKNMKKTETSTEQNSLYWCLFVAPPVRNRRGDIRVSNSSVSLLVETMHDSTHRQQRCCTLSRLPSCWEVPTILKQQ